MLRFVHTNLFDSPAQTLVNTVNTVGAMGKGIAKDFKSRYPQMYTEYKHYCKSGELVPGALHVWRGIDRWVLNFPTKTTWRKPSKLEYLEQGLHTFKHNYARLGIRSVSFPPLGCGNGELNWQEVKPLMVQYLHNLDIPVWIHELFFRGEFQPEQKDFSAVIPPETFEEFVSDFRSCITEHGGRFLHWTTRDPFRAEMGPQSSLHVFVNDRLVFDEDFLALSWVGLRLGLLTPEYFGQGNNAPGEFILPILKELPYVNTLPFEGSKTGKSTYGLLFNQVVETFNPRRLVRAARR